MTDATLPFKCCGTCHHGKDSPFSGKICGLSGHVVPKNGICILYTLGVV